MYERCAWRYVTVISRHDGFNQQRAIMLAASLLMQSRVTRSEEFGSFDEVEVDAKTCGVRNVVPSDLATICLGLR